MKDKRMKDALEAIARRGVPENTNLWPDISASLERKSPMMTLRTRPFVALLIALLTLLTLSGVVYALGRSLGYIPGLGVVDQSAPIRILAEPVSQTRDGITVSVEQVVVDSTHTIVLYKVEGLTESNFHDDVTNFQSCADEAILRIPATELHSVERVGKEGWVVYEARVSYPAIPPSVNEVTIVLPCIPATLSGSTPQNWELHLQLIPAPDEMTLFPVIELSTPGPTATIDAQTEQILLAPKELSLSLESAVQMDDGYLLYAVLDWGRTGLSVDIASSEHIHLFDANGQEVPFALVEGDSHAGMFPDKRQTIIAIKITPIRVAGPLTLTIDSVVADAAVDANFTFEPGPAPQPGQVWELNQNIRIGDGQSLRVLRATYTTTGTGPGLSFDMESDTGIFKAALTDKAHTLVASQGGGGSLDPDTISFTEDFTYDGEFPAEAITVNISYIITKLLGPWKVEWTPPALSPFIPPPHLEACITMEKLEQALEEKPPFPEGFGGRVILFGPYQGNTSVWKSVLVDLDGSNPQLLGDGDGNFSPDGTKVAFSRRMDETAERGIFIMDLATNQTTLLPGTSHLDFNPLWSPDGSQIVFNRGGVFDLYAINVDGSNMRRLTVDQGQEFVIGWLPDGQHLLYTLPGAPYQQTDHIVDVRSGAIEYFANEEFLGLSPDTKHKITAERDSTNMDSWTSYFSNLDGTNSWVLAKSGIVLQFPVWSDDGEWLLVSLSQLYNDKYTPAFVHLTDCQIIPLPELDGIVLDWQP